MQTFDLMLTGGHLIDPSQGLDGQYDIAINDGRIAAILPKGSPAQARESIRIDQRLVLPGLIDTHAHVFQHVTGRFGLEADLCGVRSGVTTLIDQGGPSCMTLPAFREYVVKPKQTRIFAYLSAYLVGGLEGHYYPSFTGPIVLMLRLRSSQRWPIRISSRASRHMPSSVDLRAGALM